MIELTTKWLARAFLNPQDIPSTARRTRDLTNYAAAELVLELLPDRCATLDAVMGPALQLNTSTWITVARKVMRKRNDTIHGFWMPPDEDGVAAFRDRYHQRIPMSVEELEQEVLRAETAAQSGVDVFRFVGQALQIPTVTAAE